MKVSGIFQAGICCFTPKIKKTNPISDYLPLILAKIILIHSWAYWNLYSVKQLKRSIKLGVEDFSIGKKNPLIYFSLITKTRSSKRNYIFNLPMFMARHRGKSEPLFSSKCIQLRCAIELLNHNPWLQRTRFQKFPHWLISCTAFNVNT